MALGGLHLLALSGANGIVITADRLRELLDYNPDTGLFHWRITKSNRVRVGDEAGYYRKDGYCCIRIEGRLYLGQRLAWLYVYGEWPSKNIDHIDQNKSNNRIDNLRNASQTINNYNTRLRKDNASGYQGVTKSGNRWIAQVHQRIDGVRKNHTKSFGTPEEAHEWYVQKKAEIVEALSS